MSTILIVDDMAICRETLAAALQAHGHATICAADGTEALSILQERPADLVLLDVSMPGLDGLAVLRTIRCSPGLRQIPVILLTDRAERHVVIQAAGHGIHGYILKSNFSLDELLARVDGCVSRDPIASASSTDARKTGGRERFANWRSGQDPKSTAAPAPFRSPTPAAPVKQIESPHGLPAHCDQAKTPSAKRSVDDLAPLITKGELMKVVSAGLELRPLGPTVHNVIAVTSNAGCCAEDVAKAVSHDQALSIRLLKLANSSAYSRGHLVNSVKDAVQRIGIHEVRSLVMTLGVFEQFRGAAAEHVDPHLFWEHSIACGLTASALAQGRQAVSADDCFLWGMLHDVGRLILLEHASDQYASVWDAAKELNVPLEAVEARMMLLDHCDILKQALQHWQFPPEFIPSVVNHHASVSNIKRLAPAQVEAAATVALANRISHALLLGSSGNEVIYPLDDLMALVEVRPAMIAEIVNRMPSETNDLKFTMLARANEDSWSDFVSQVKSRLNVPFRPLCVSAEPEVDSYRMFCERVADPLGTDAPNLGVMYLRDAAELASLAVAYDAEERAQDAANTPVILICNKGQVDKDVAWLRERRHFVFKAPVCVPALFATMADLIE